LVFLEGIRTCAHHLPPNHLTWSLFLGLVERIDAGCSAEVTIAFSSLAILKLGQSGQTVSFSEWALRSLLRSFSWKLSFLRGRSFFSWVCLFLLIWFEQILFWANYSCISLNFG
jgi:hypothetical protein